MNKCQILLGELLLDLKKDSLDLGHKTKVKILGKESRFLFEYSCSWYVIFPFVALLLHMNFHRVVLCPMEVLYIES